jgi:sigma-E factor negative regulatory protein RseB
MPTTATRRPTLSTRRAAAAALLLAAGVAAAGTPPSPTPLLPEAGAWLQRVREAGRCRNYQGTLVSSDGVSVSSSRVMHFCEGGHELESVETLDGKASFTLRHDDVMHSARPGSKTVVVAQRDELGSFPARLPLGDFRIEDHYELTLLGEDRVAGYGAESVLLKPRDKLRFAQRLWADRKSGLLLRADVIEADGTMLERVGFSDVSIDGRAQPEAIKRRMNELKGWRVVRPEMHRSTLEAEGWTLAAPAAGFRLVSTVKRQIEGVEARDGEAALLVLQAIYSDGLTHVSLFIEPYDAQRHPRVTSTRIGATYTTMRRFDEFWVTLVGDVPLVTLQKFADALKRSR